MDSIVSTTIVNHGSPMNLSFGTRSAWLPHATPVTVPFDVWSVAPAGVAESLKALLRDGKLELTLHVVGRDGNTVDIPLGLPQDNARKQEIAKSYIDHTTRFLQQSGGATTMKTIIAGGDGTVGRMAGNVVGMPGTSEDNVVKPFGGAAQDVQVKLGSEAAAEAAAEASKEEDKVSAAKARFDELVSGRRWTAALGVLKETFDGVDFDAKEISSVKDFDKLVEKHGLKAK